MNSLKALKYLY